MEGNTEKLVITAIASFASVIGYGNVYRCQIVSTVSGDLDQKEFNMTILASDKEKLAFMAKQPAGEKFEIGCSKRNLNEPYSLMPISGFVDNNRTSWEIEYFKRSSLSQPPSDFEQRNHSNRP